MGLGFTVVIFMIALPNVGSAVGQGPMWVVIHSLV